MINVTALKARVHYALTQTAIELSLYGHVAHVTGLSPHMQTMAAGAQATDEMFANLNTMISTLDIQGGVGFVEDVIDDPVTFLMNFVYSGLTIASHEAIIRPIFNKYMRLFDQNAATFLENNRATDGSGLVAGFLGNVIAFDGSHLITPEGDILIIATYNIDFTFGFLPLVPERFGTIEVTQSVKTRVWLGGYGDGFNR